MKPTDGPESPMNAVPTSRTVIPTDCYWGTDKSFCANCLCVGRPLAVKIREDGSAWVYDESHPQAHLAIAATKRAMAQAIRSGGVPDYR